MFAVNVKRNIAESDIYRALGLFIKTLFDGEVFRGMTNRVPLPQSGKNFVVMQALYSNALSTTSVFYKRNQDQQTLSKTTVAVYQIDCYGPDSYSLADSLATAFRSDYACEFFRENGNVLQPLYTSETRQLTFINGSRQYEERWSIDLHVQPNLTTTLPQQFMDGVDLKYKPLF